MIGVARAQRGGHERYVPLHLERASFPWKIPTAVSVGAKEVITSEASIRQGRVYGMVPTFLVSVSAGIYSDLTHTERRWDLSSEGLMQGMGIWFN